MLDLNNDIKEIIDEMISIRRYIHQNAEVGFKLNNTLEFVKEKLHEYGYKAYECGKCGIYVDINKGYNKTILLRADMDGLPIKEEADIEYKADNNMHACGHDIHTTILLGVAKLLKKYDNELNFNVRLAFQPAEEILAGAQDMINDGLLDNVDEAYMLHVILPTNYHTGTIIISDDEVSAPSCDYFQIKAIGKSVHGAMPSLGIDPIIIGSNIVSSLKHIATNEISYLDSYTLTFGTICGGETFNVIPDEVILKGTLRTFNEEIRSYSKNRIVEISNHIAKAYNGRVEINFPQSAPVLINDKVLVNNTYSILKESDLNVIKTSEMKNKSKASGSEDFAYVSQKVSSVMMNLCAGNIKDGYKYPLHNSKVIFDEDSIFYGIKTFLLLILNKKKLN